QVWTINTDGGGATQLTFDSALKGQVPDWAPDGSKIAYNSGDDIWLMNANGSDSHPLFVDPSTIEFGPAWSPVGDQIAFVSFPLGNLGGRTMFVINADGSRKYAVHPGPGPTNRAGLAAARRPNRLGGLGGSRAYRRHRVPGSQALDTKPGCLTEKGRNRIRNRP